MHQSPLLHKPFESTFKNVNIFLCTTTFNHKTTLSTFNNLSLEAYLRYRWWSTIWVHPHGRWVPSSVCNLNPSFIPGYYSVSVSATCTTVSFHSWILELCVACKKAPHAFFPLIWFLQIQHVIYVRFKLFGWGQTRNNSVLHSNT